ncbi:lipid-A-disaccharide synthase [Vibrio vulnificus]|uniref:Lipid-A-disaccharide synthase n=3 Tax=Vibrio vulnificus TaxID=672 RepID=LPXB_VIBVU|nr:MULTISPECIES: lipid-A-disaccharide synthase [Vibrio]Q7MIH2.1 RecName: Full=Lipid-A-disaccharide synthase [Vibrio vulnificus YJ016]Q8DBE8.1 RecName: Full=Lipid-A-disaccharide synthase [Vibrio vulnificus CMCP6]OJI59852.1 Lipid-A-disaccharide synthase [Vibrio fluvialis]AAO10275.1 lipid-A-disaccharide synthase [Vibrio vulnificus CMCP6]AIL71341.1 lipid-A-disaccharide synthase [Vibrio vulnificus]ALM70160.1 Lipid-A-disaccharide synthase [Vibrio vulnificus]AMG12857.1 lipid-A-disaccharide synthase
MSNKPLRIGIVAGELSGDTLGEGFIKAIKAVHPDAEFVGIGGPKMIALGCQSLFDMEELAVMGLVEVLGRLPRLLKVKAELVRYFTENPPDVFVGIDAPDFNLRLELDLKNAGIKTVHYVSPSVWAWRQKRIFKIAKATHLVLAFLPFEKAFYDKFNVPCEFIGHTLADAIPLESDKAPARELLGLEQDKQWLAVLPGSRGSELKMLSQPFIETCKKLQQAFPELGFVVALVNQKRREQFEQAWKEYAPELDFKLVDDTARNVITASDAVMLASGTVALECMLLKRPMVVGYRVNAVTAFLAKRLLKTQYVSLPNILADTELVKEYLQDDCTPDNLFGEVSRLLEGDNHQMLDKFTEMHHWIRKDADQQAANAVLKLIEK